MMSFPKLALLVLEDWYREELKKINIHKFDKDNWFIYLGEIPNMPGHCVVAGHESGKIYSGYHIDNFKLSPDHDYWVDDMEGRR